MTDQQLYIAVGVPMLFNAVLIGLLMAYVNVKVDGVRVDVKALDRRFDDLRDLWRAELLRVEGVIDARLRHLEEERH